MASYATKTREVIWGGKQVGDPDHLKVFANADAAAIWFEENDPEGVAFEYEVMGLPGQRLNSGDGAAS
jgi:hypothetical protein